MHGSVSTMSLYPHAYSPTIWNNMCAWTALSIKFAVMSLSFSKLVHFIQALWVFSEKNKKICWKFWPNAKWSVGGTRMLRCTGMCHTNGWVFHKKSLYMDSIFFKKSLEVGPISCKLEKKSKISSFLPSNWVPIYKSCKKEKHNHQNKH